jgi:hypothetical protein
MIPLPTLRTALVIGAVIIAVIFGGLWLHDRDERVRAEGRLELVRVELDSARAQSDRRVEASDRRAAEAEAVTRRERIAREAAERRIADAVVRQPAAADSIVVIAATGDTAAVRARVEQLQALHEEERAGWTAVVRSQDLVIAELRALDLTRVSAIDALERRALAAEVVADAALATRPGWFERTGWKIAVPLAFAAGWWANGQVGG